MFKRKKNGETPQTPLTSAPKEEQNTNDFDAFQQEETPAQEAPKVFTPRTLGRPEVSTSTQPSAPAKPVKGKNRLKEFQPNQTLGVDVTQDMVKELKIPEFDEPQLNKRRRNKVVLLSSVGVLLVASVVIFTNLGKSSEPVVSPEDTLPPQPPLEVVQPPTTAKPDPKEPLVSDPSTTKQGYSPYHNLMLGMRLEYPSYLYTKDLTEYYLNFIRSAVPNGQGYHLPSLDFSMVGASIPLVEFEMRDKASTAIRFSFVNPALTSDLVIQPDYDKAAVHREYTLESFSDEMSVYHIDYITYERELERVTKENEKRANNRKLPLPIEPTLPSSVVDDSVTLSGGNTPSTETPVAEGSTPTSNTEGTPTTEGEVLTVDWSVISDFSPRLYVSQSKGLNKIILQLVKPYESSSLVATLSYEYNQGTTLTTEMLETLKSMLETTNFDNLGADGKVIPPVTDAEFPDTETPTPENAPTEGGTKE